VSSSSAQSPPATPAPVDRVRDAPAPLPRLGITLAVIVTCQLMVGLDSTIVTIALPNIRTELHFSDTSLAWVQNAYMLAFGGLLLLGARAGDILGRRRVFVTGIAVFTVASLLCGLATSPAWLLTARAAQGVGAAIAAPSTMALLITNFPEGDRRNRALAVYSAVSGAGGSLGLVLGGVLTSWASWPWVFYVNVPIGALLVLAAPRVIHEPERHRGRFDVLGAVTSSMGMSALVYGFIRVGSTGWSDTAGLVSFVVSVVLLGAFLANERRAAQPIVPLHLFASRVRSSAFLNQLLFSAAMFGVFFFLTQYLQDGLGFSPLAAGVGFLPLSVGLFATVRVVPRLLKKFGARPVMLAGALLIAGAYGWLTQLAPGSTYAEVVLGPLILFGVGVGCTFMPLNMTIMTGVAPQESGAASGLAQTMMWVGGSLGLGILVTVFGSAQRHAAATAPAGLNAVQRAHYILAHSVSSAFVGGTVFTVLALLIVIFVIRAKPQTA
jgi:EmrB/QacA subfamily drug resistance transporter